MTANDLQTPAWTWNNWKGHGRPQRFYYWGQDRKAANDAMGQLIVSVDTSSPSWYKYLGADGKQVTQGGVATKFWASPVPVGQPPANDRKHRAAIEITKPAKVNRNLKPCACGCGAQVHGLYKQGHDARHVSKLVAAWVASDSDTVPDDLISQLPSPALQAKLANAIARKVSGKSHG